MSFATSDERYFVGLVNQVRKDKGLSTLKIEQSLNLAADTHSKWMLDADVFSHTGQGGSRPKDRIEAAGFDFQVYSWMTAENLAYVSIDNDGSLRDEIQQLHRNLMNSPGHYANIINERTSLIGIGLQVGNFTSGGREYKVLMATQNFADTTGDYKLDTGKFPSAAAPKMPKMESRKDWLADMDGKIFISTSKSLTGTIKDDDFRLGAKSDKAIGGAGDDWMEGRLGNDTLNGGAGKDRLLGQGGNDVLFGGAGNDVLSGGIGNDRLQGQSGNDVLLGDAGIDRLEGGLGDDYLHGGAGADKLFGGAGADTIIGGAGADLLVGGAGADSFVFHRGHGRDTINGYEVGVDRLLINDRLLGKNHGDWIESHIRETKTGVVIDFGRGDVIVINGKNLDVDDIVDDTFSF